MTTWFGTQFTVNRAKRYRLEVHWMYHSDYMQHTIARAYTGDKARALYRSKIGEEEYLVGDSLTEIKNVIRLYKTQGRDFFQEVKQ